MNKFYLPEMNREEVKKIFDLAVKKISEFIQEFVSLKVVSNKTRKNMKKL